MYPPITTERSTATGYSIARPLHPIVALALKQGSSDDAAWISLARAEVRVWERDPAIGHDHLRCACDAYRCSIDLLEPGFVQVPTYVRAPFLCKQ